MIGIDLGTVNSCVGIYKCGRIDYVPHGDGSRILPSYVYYGDRETVVGDAAKQKTQPKKVIYDSKRFIGKKDREFYQKVKKYYPFDIDIDDSDNVFYIVENSNSRKKYTPEDVSTEILKKIYISAKEYLGDIPITGCVITVPAYFNLNQKRYTMVAAQRAGLPNPKLLTEPVAAAYAYGYDHSIGNKKILIYDLGGGTFDVSVISVSNEKMKVLAIGGDNFLGGRDFDNNIVKHFNNMIINNGGDDVFQHPRKLLKLRKACEQAKIMLSSSFEIEVDYESDLGDIILSRTVFELLNEELFKKTITIVVDTLKSAGLSRHDIDDVVLVGGSSKICKIKELLTDFFGKTPKCDINPDEAVANGATLAANTSLILNQMSIIDIIPFDIGIKTSTGFSTIIPKQTQIPTIEFKKTYTPSRDFENYVDIVVMNKCGRETFELFTLSVYDIIPKKKGEVKIDVSLSINSDGLLRCSAIETYSNKTKKKEININA